MDRPTNNRGINNEERVTLSRMAYERLTNAISEGKFRMGQTFTAESLTKDLGISKTPVREALVSLESEGIISKIGRLYSIVYLDEKQIDEIYELRRELETLGAYLAAIRMSESDRKELKQAARLIYKAHKNNADPITLANLSGKLHLLIARGSQNSLLVKEVTGLRLKLRIVRVSLFTSVERREDEYKEHMAIVDSIVKKKADQAKKAMYEHQTNVWKYVKSSVIPMLYH